MGSTEKHIFILPFRYIYATLSSLPAEFSAECSEGCSCFFSAFRRVYHYFDYRAHAQKGRFMQKEKLNTVPPSFQEVTGPIDVTLRNDMLFHKVMELSNSTLKGLICSLKGLNPDDVKEVTVLNPIDYSESVGKEIILDVKVLMNLLIYSLMYALLLF